MAHVGLAWARLGICIWGRETDAGGEETVPGSRGDKQLAANVCTYPTLAGICLWTLGMFTLESDRCDSVVRTHSSVRGEKGAHCDKYQTCNRTVLVAESLQPNPSETSCTSFCRQGWRATASSSWKYHRNSLMGKDILDVLGSFVNPKPICCQQKTSLSMLYIPSRAEFPWSNWSRQDRTRTLWKPRILPRPPTLPHQLYFLSPINQISWMSREPMWMGKYLFFYLTWLLVWSYIFLEQFCSGWSHLCLNELTGIILWTASSTISCALQGRRSLGSILDEFPFLL